MSRRRRKTDAELESEYWDRRDSQERYATGWQTQDQTDDTHTSVKAGFSHNLQTPTTEFIIADRDEPGHQHVVITDEGDEIHNQRVDGR